jgi:hypothetical protein
MFEIPRSSLARHARHVPPHDRKLGLIPPPPPEDPRVDPLDEAFALIGRAKTERERLKALEQVRAATALRLREMGTPDEEVLQLLDDNVRAAMSAYRDGGESFEHAIRGLQGLREAIRQRMDAIQADETIETRYVVQFYTPAGSVGQASPGKPFKMSAALYFADTPARYHDFARFRVERTIHLEWNGPGRQDLKVYEVGSDALVWAKDDQMPKRPSRDGKAGRRDQEDEPARQ